MGHVFVEMKRELGQNCGGEGLRIGSSLWIEGGSGSNVNACGRGWEKVILRVGGFPDVGGAAAAALVPTGAKWGPAGSGPFLPIPSTCWLGSH